MKKNYIFLLLVTLTLFSYSQTIVTVDRPNVTGPTSTDDVTSMSSIGLVRGSGVNLSTSSSTDFTSRDWDSSDQASAAAANEYMEWSVSADASFNVTVDEFDIRLRRHGNGPSNWQIFYSLDNFSTAGTAVSVPQTMPATSSFEFNFSGLGISSGTAGTITFRLYAWDANTAGGWLRVTGQPSWSGSLGIADPGIRIIGNVTSGSSNSTESDIVNSSLFDVPDNIDYTSYTVSSGLTTANSIQIGQFIIRDGGSDFSDPDLLGTILTDVGFDIDNFSNLEAIAIFDGALNVGEVSVTGSSVTINNLNGGTGVSSSDGGPKSFDVYATFKSNVTDNEQIQLTINTAIADGILGSVFGTFNAGGAQTSIAGDDNRIEVATTGIVFGQQPSDTFQFEIMTPFPTVIAVDDNGNQNLDESISLTIATTGGNYDGPPTFTLSNGLAILDNLVFTEQATGVFIFIVGGGFVISDQFDINGPLISIAIQDFDGTTPEWTYTTDVTTFDNGWGTDGYYDIIDSANAAPIDNTSFTGNIFGEHDLSDEGDNGTTGFATLTFDTIDISAFDNVTLTFDWDVHGYDDADDDAMYTLIYDGVAQPDVFLLDGGGVVDTDQGTVSVNIPNTVNTISLQVSVRDDGDNGFSGFDNFKLTSLFDGLLYVDNGWEPNAPSDTTGSEDVLIFDGTYVVGSNIEVNSFYINNGATTSVSAAQSITTNSVLVNFGTLELNSVSTSYSSLITDNIQGEVTYNRHVNQFQSTPGAVTGQNDLVSAPVTNANQTFIPFRTANPDIPSGTIGGVPSFLFGPFDNNANEYVNYSNTDDPLIEAGIGYRTASIVPTGSALSFTGDVQTGSITVPITVGTGSIFNLVGNPYPSYISLSSFLTANNSEFDAGSSGVYGYDGSATDGYTVWNQAFSDANPTAVITPGQGFLVSSVSGGGNISFTPAMRSIGTTDDFIAGRNSNPPTNAFLNLELSSNDNSYKTDLYFNENASLGMDSGYDATIFNAETPNFAIFSHLVQDNNGIDMSVQSVDYSALGDVIIPLGVNANIGEQITFSIANTNITEDVTIILEDNVTNTFTDLRNSDYSIEPNTTLSSTGRFYIHFSNQQLSVSDDILNGLEIYTTTIPRQIVVRGQLEATTKLQVIDIQGRIVSSAQLNTSDTNHSIDVSNLSPGIYIVQLQNNNATRTQKVILK